jgi:large subunit ribosomal protein L35
MPKMKTKRGAAKRFKKAGGNRLKARRANRGHILTKKTQDRKRRLRANITLSGPSEKLVKRMLNIE